MISLGSDAILVLGIIYVFYGQNNVLRLLALLVFLIMISVDAYLTWTTEDEMSMFYWRVGVIGFIAMFVAISKIKPYQS